MSQTLKQEWEVSDMESLLTAHHPRQPLLISHEMLPVRIGQLGSCIIGKVPQVRAVNRSEELAFLLVQGKNKQKPSYSSRWLIVQNWL